MTPTDAGTAADRHDPEDRVIRVSAAVIHDRAGRLLLVRKTGTSAFMQPGGKPEPGESAAETLARELEEELGVMVAPGGLVPLGTYRAAAANEAGFDVVAEVFAADIGIQVPRIAAEIAELRWVSAAEAADLPIAPLARNHFLPS